MAAPRAAVHTGCEMLSTATVLAFLGNVHWREGFLLTAVIAIFLGLRLRKAVHGR